MRSLSCRTITLTTAALGTVAAGISYVVHQQQQQRQQSGPIGGTLIGEEEEQRQLDRGGIIWDDDDGGSSSGNGGRKPEPQCLDYHKCDCFTCGDVTEKDDGTIDIQINHCKNKQEDGGGQIDWICCSAVDGVAGICDVTTCGGYAKCDGMASGQFTVNIPKDSTSFQINTHDDSTAGNALNLPGICGGPKGGQEGSCVDDFYTSHCLIDFVVETDCGYKKNPPPQPEHHSEPVELVVGRQTQEVDDDSDCNDIDEDQCFSAFAHYRPDHSWCLADLGFQYSHAINDESGWTNGPFKCCFSRPYEMTLYTDAPGCHTENITQVGSVSVHKEGEEVSIDFNLDSELNYTLKETHVYAGDTRIPKSESEFPFWHKVTKRVGCVHLQDSYSIGGFDPQAGVYVVAHALICPAPKATLIPYEKKDPEELEEEECPENQPELNSACNFPGECPYGEKRCCDGSIRETFNAVCLDGKVKGYHIDACFGVECEDDEEEPEESPTPSPEDESEEEAPDLHFEGFRDCAELSYDFGYLSVGCQSGSAILYDSLVKTHFGEGVDEESCNIHNLGQFDLVCSDPAPGNDTESVQNITITPSLDSNVIVQGTDGGILFTNLRANSTYTLELGRDEGPAAGIEFCFRCGCANTTATSSPIAPPTSTSQPTEVPSAEPTEAPSTTPTSPGPTSTPTAIPTLQPTVTTETPTVPPTVSSGHPSANPTTLSPTGRPTTSPTAGPTKEPTGTPTETPTVQPTIASGHPSANPTTLSPTGRPTTSPTAGPTKAPTGTPTETPTVQPTIASGHPSANPTTESPTDVPTLLPTIGPTREPTGTPTETPTVPPTVSSGHPSASPTTLSPTGRPTSSPTGGPTKGPTGTPTASPTDVPTISSGHPSASPTTESPTGHPPTAGPTKGPTGTPTFVPTVSSGHPSASPTTLAPTELPTSLPTLKPSNATTGTPTRSPTSVPTVLSGHPSVSPTTEAPTVPPSPVPTESPSVAPTSGSPTFVPTVASGHPSSSPSTEAPTVAPTAAPTEAPSIAPTSASPTMSPTNPYTGQFDCQQKGYDFGFQMENCFPRKAVEIDGLDQTPFRNGVDQGTCQVSDVGQFDLKCSDRDMSRGGLPTKAHIIPSVDTAIIVQGLSGGVLYEDLKAGVNYTLDAGNLEPITDIEFCMKCNKNKTTDRTGSSFGDPHIKTWGGGHFDFHGGCDLILVESPSYGKGLGLSIHIRTKVTDWWSYIDSAVLQIGKDRLEVHGIKDEHKARYWVNGTVGPDLVDGQYLNVTVGGQKIQYHDRSKKTKVFQLKDFSIETFGDFVRVNVHAKHGRDFVGAVGLMGSYPSGSRVGREGQIIWNKNHFGMEWQVRMEEPKLFHKVEGVQHPQPCEIPSMMQSRTTDVKRHRRRLGETLSKDDAAHACAPVEKEYFKDCIADVLATNDRGMAAAYY